MPFPWNKVKSEKLSRLVNDHLHNSQRRRDDSSLVVETGFPTSLVDLFIKNRKKLNRTSKKKREKIPSTSPVDVNNRETGVLTTSMPFSDMPNPSSMNSPVISESQFSPSLRHPSPIRSPSPFHSEDTKDIVGLEAPDRGTRVSVNDVEKRVNAYVVLMGVLTIFLVMLLVLGMKRLTVEITVSAFLLLFLEYVCASTTRCSEAKGILKLRLRRVCMLLRLKKDKMDDKNGCDPIPIPAVKPEDLLNSRGPSGERSQSKCPDQKVQSIEPNSEGICCQKALLVDNSSEAIRIGYQEIETKEVVMEKEESSWEVALLKRRRSGRQKLKSNIKKICPKKLRSSKKEQLNVERFDYTVEEKCSSLVEKHVDEIKEGSESNTPSRTSLIPNRRYSKEDGTSAICALSAETPTTNKEEEREESIAGQAWTNLVVVLIVLVGLIGGRGFALVLTLLWFLLMKFDEKLQ